MEYYNQLMEKARAYRGLAMFYKNAGHDRWRMFAELGKQTILKAIEVRNNI